ncbi:hypothetical protein [Photorhabdus caribbeanensis]|uniref:hypothetical protein n=1 Tax=Photorhabdus caribbeanensis TaxID=1004165 RepID=UPI001BD46B94|nr:hypothetical protein [Photorhabdus caribbeanensis]MBS9424193.1 hypothetical protein [Photorhabdus caribbeanensis]
MRQLLTIIGMVILVGCTSSTTEQQQLTAPIPPKNDKLALVSRELSVAWDNMGRGGAALNQPGYIHVLGNGNVGVMQNKATDGSTLSTSTIPNGVKKGDVNKALNTFKSMGKGYSLYELSRWTRYCNRGKGMDEHDWRFIETEGPNNIPKEAVINCVPPTYNYQDYINAWTYFCTSQVVTDVNRRIVRDSIRPFSVASLCNVLK